MGQPFALSKHSCNLLFVLLIKIFTILYYNNLRRNLRAVARPTRDLLFVLLIKIFTILYYNNLRRNLRAVARPTRDLLFVLFIQANTPNRAVENGVFHYPVGPFVFRVTAAFAISLI